jgi:hypothetical protein
MRFPGMFPLLPGHRSEDYLYSMRANLLPAAGVGAIMGFLAAREGSGPGAAVVVGVVGCALVLGMIALKQYFTRGN